MSGAALFVKLEPADALDILSGEAGEEALDRLREQLRARLASDVESKRWTLSLVFGAWWSVKGPNINTRSSVEVMPVSEHEEGLEDLATTRAERDEATERARLAEGDAAVLRGEANDLQARLESKGLRISTSNVDLLEGKLRRAEREREELRMLALANGGASAEAAERADRAGAALEEAATEFERRAETAAHVGTREEEQALRVVVAYLREKQAAFKGGGADGALAQAGCRHRNHVGRR